MKDLSVKGYLNGVVFFSFFVLLFALEFFGHVIEKGIGNYLKWGNHERTQLGRMWERDQEQLAAKKKIQSILSNQNLRQASTESIKSFKELFRSLTPSFPLLVTRDKFLQLYFDFPGQWARRIISPYELIEIDSDKTWRRVILNRFGTWVTVSFINAQNHPIREVFLSINQIEEIESTRSVEEGNLESLLFQPESIYPIQEFLQVMRTLDPVTQQSLFPDPQWFLSKEFHITRVGVQAENSGFPDAVVFGIEYETDFLTHVLLIPVPQEIANNMLSLIERSPQEKPRLGAFDALPYDGGVP